MANKRRLWLSGFWYHVYSRGQRKNPLFFNPADFTFFLNTMNETLSQCKITLGAFCLMRNHYHMLVKMGELPLEKALHKLHLKYAIYFNNKYSTTGYVYQGRPGVKMVLRDEYLQYVVSYIHQNPYKKKRAVNEVGYRWSSEVIYRRSKIPGIDFNYWEYPPGITSVNFNDPIDEKEYEYLNGNLFVGLMEDLRNIVSQKRWQIYAKVSGAFGQKPIDKYIQNHYNSDEIEICQQETRSKKRDELRHNMILALRQAGYSTVQLSNYFNCSRSVISQIAPKRLLNK